MGYLGEIADYFIQRRGGALFLSHRDYQRILSWEQRGIPPRLVRQAIQETFDGQRGPDGKLVRPVRSIAYVEQVVLRQHKALLRSLLPENHEVEESLSVRIGRELPAYREELSRSIGAAGLARGAETALALDSELRELQEEAEAGSLNDYEEASARFQELDRRLEEYLVQVVPAALREELSQEAAARLAGGGTRSVGALAPRALKAMEEELIRRRYGLGRIALYAVV